jgi:hypothetical protein
VTELSDPKPREIDLPRWVQIPAGIILGLFALFCAIASLLLLLPAPNNKLPALTIPVFLMLFLGCCWVLEKCFQLISGQKKKGGFLSPTALRVVSYVMLVLPIVALFTGAYREGGILVILQALIYFLGSFGLRALARKREESQASAHLG